MWSCGDGSVLFWWSVCEYVRIMKLEDCLNDSLVFSEKNWICVCSLCVALMPLSVLVKLVCSVSLSLCVAKVALYCPLWCPRFVLLLLFQVLAFIFLLCYARSVVHVQRNGCPHPQFTFFYYK